MRGVCISAFMLLASPGALADADYTALLDEAVAAIHWNFEDDWAYTETTLREDRLWVGRHDPRVAENNGWTLVSVDGRDPTAAEIREFLDDKEGDDETPDDDDNRVVRIVERDSLTLIEETDEHWLFSFVPDEDEKFMQHVEATLHIAKDGRYVESLKLRNIADLKPGFGTRLTSFLTQFTFGPAIEGGPIVPKDIKVRVAGRALLFITIDETEVVQYSDFDFAGN